MTESRESEESPEDVFEAVLKELQDWKWERFVHGTAAEFQARLDEDAQRWRDRFAAALGQESHD